MICILLIVSMLSPLSMAIINGSVAGQGEFPSMVSLQWDGEHRCGGTLLNKNTILTTAHCFPLLYDNRNDPNKATALMGTNDYTSDSAPAQRRVIDRGIWLPGFKDEWKTMELFREIRSMDEMSNIDYLLLKLKEEVAESSVIKYARLANGGAKQPNKGDVCVMPGFGRTKALDTLNITTKYHSRILRKATLKVVDPTDCLAKGNTAANYPNVLCLKQNMGAERGIICFGDFGGPTLCKDSNGADYLAGAQESSEVPCTIPTAGVWAQRVSTKKDWILQNL